jgi:hypothetical protein
MIKNVEAAFSEEKMHLVFVKGDMPLNIPQRGMLHNILNGDLKKYYEDLNYTVDVVDDYEKAAELLNNPGWNVENTIVLLDIEALEKLKKLQPKINSKVLAIQKIKPDDFIPVTDLFNLMAIVVRINKKIADGDPLKIQLSNYLAACGIEIEGDKGKFVEAIANNDHKDDPFAFAERFNIKLPPIKPENIEANYKAMKEVLTSS